MGWRYILNNMVSPYIFGLQRFIFFPFAFFFVAACCCALFALLCTLSQQTATITSLCILIVAIIIIIIFIIDSVFSSLVRICEFVLVFLLSTFLYFASVQFCLCMFYNIAQQVYGENYDDMDKNYITFSFLSGPNPLLRSVHIAFFCSS